MSESPAAPTPRTHRVRAALTGRAGLRALGALAIVLVALFFPVAITTVLFEVAAVGLLVVGVHGVWISLRSSRTRWLEVARDLSVAAAGGAILWLRFTGQGAVIIASLAIILAVRGLVQLVGVVRDRERRRSVWPYLPPIAQALVAALLWVVPASLSIVAIAIALTWIASGAINLQRALTDPHADPAGLAETGTAVMDYLRNQDVGDETREQVEQSLFFEGQLSTSRLWRFVALMSFSTAIATFGIASDSTAVVIGAMLVAPLMTPILGMSASIVTGSTERLGRSAAVVALGVAVAIALSFLLSKYVGGFLDVERNTQIASRVAPTLVDLAIAVAAGAAGAFANARRDVADSLPGVAIAVALVPPLSVVGTVLQEGELSMAVGAFLLFATNLVGIIVAASVTFFLLGLAPWFHVEARSEMIGRSFATAAVALVLVAIPLAISGEDLITSATNQARIQQIIDDVAADTPYEIVSIDITAARVEVLATGPPDADDLDITPLAEDLRETVGRDFTLVVRVVPESVFELEVLSTD
ncbi:MAG: DUF389 domain-containing protein [Acidimicrobiia bacterium]